MRASNWPAANYNFLAIFGFLADGLLHLADLGGIEIRRENGLQTAPKKIHTRGQMRFLGSKPASLDPTISVEKKIRAAFREKGIDAEIPLNELFAGVTSSGEGKKKFVEKLVANVAALIGEPVHAFQQNNVVPLFPNSSTFSEQRQQNSRAAINTAQIKTGAIF